MQFVATSALVGLGAMVSLGGCTKVSALEACQQLQAKGVTASCSAAGSLSEGGVRTGASEEAQFRKGSLFTGNWATMVSGGTIALYPSQKSFEAAVAGVRPPKESDPISLYLFASSRRRVTLRLAMVGAMPEESRRQVQAALDAL